MEMGRDDYLFRGRYDMMSIVLGIGAGAHPNDTDVRF